MFCASGFVVGCEKGVDVALLSFFFFHTCCNLARAQAYLFFWGEGAVIVFSI